MSGAPARPARSAVDEFADDLARRLAALDEQGLLRRLEAGGGVDLVSNDFLGLCGHVGLRERAREALDAGVVGAGGARLLCRQGRVFQVLEERLADFCGAESALLFATGYAANTGVLQALIGRDDLVLSDALNHASLIDGIRMSGARKVVYPHLDLDAVEDALRARRDGGGRAFIVTESVFGMDGDFAPLLELTELAERHGALLIVDEAHATGLYGRSGAGRVEELGLRGRVLACVHTGGKALGSAGAWVAGPAALREWLINRARPFMFSTAPLPALAALLDAALDVLADEPWRRTEVHRKAALVRAELARAGVPCIGHGPIVPVVVGRSAAAVELQRRLMREGFDVRAVRPPTVPAGTARLRVCVRVPVDDHELTRFASALGRCRREHGGGAWEAARP